MPGHRDSNSGQVAIYVIEKCSEERRRASNVNLVHQAMEDDVPWRKRHPVLQDWWHERAYEEGDS